MNVDNPYLYNKILVIQQRQFLGYGVVLELLRKLLLLSVQQYTAIHDNGVCKERVPVFIDICP